MPFQPTTPLSGVDLNNTYTTPNFALNTRVEGTANTLWTYALANGVISAGDCVTVSQLGTATRATAAGVATPGNTVAFAQNAFAGGDYGWVALNGRAMTVSVSGTANANTQLYVATSSGKLSTTASSGTLVGVSIASTSATAVATTTTGDLTWPKCVTPGF